MIDANSIWQYISIFGDMPFWIGLFFGTVLIYIVLRRKSKNKVAWVMFSLIPATAIATIVSTLMKLLLKIPRPCIDIVTCPPTYSFPSNHAAAIFAFALVVSMNIKNWKVWVGVGTLAVLVSISRIALDVHTPIDVVGGAVIGVVSAIIFQKSYRKLYRFWVSKSPEGSLSRLLGTE